MILRGERVLLRPMERSDAPVIARIAAEPAVARWWGELSQHELASKAAGDDVVALVVEASGAAIGMIQYFEEPDPVYRHASIDLFLSALQHGRGLGREAVAVVVDHLFHVLGHHRVTVDPAAANLQAISCYSAVGFTPVGVMRRYERGPDGGFHDGLLMELVREPQ